MIVSCTSCQTRFRVNPEKIGPRGARLRCRRCGTTFVVPPVPAGPGEAPYPDLAPSLQAAAPQPVPPQPALEPVPPVEPARPQPALPLPPQPELESASWSVSDAAGPVRLPPPPSRGTAEPAAPSSPDPFARSISLETDPFAPVSEAPREDPFAAASVRSPSAFERDPFALPMEPAESLAESLSPIDDPFAPPPEPRPPGASLDASRALSGSLDLVGPLDLHPPRESAAAGQDLEAPATELERLLGGGTGLSLSQIPDLALEGPPGFVLDRDPGPALDRDPEGPGSTPGFALAAGAVGGAGEASEEAPASGPSRRAHEFTSPVPGPGPGPRPEPDQAPASGSLGGPQRSRTSAAAAALSLAFMVAAAAVTFFAWRGSMSAHPGQTARSEIEAEGVSAGPYDTAAGTTVLVVHGRVTARERVAGPVQVEAQLWDRGNLVATAGGAAGGSATPEEIHAVGTSGEAEALRRALDARAARGLAAGDSAPFLILFPPPAPKLRGLELRVVASAAAGAR